MFFYRFIIKTQRLPLKIFCQPLHAMNERTPRLVGTSLQEYLNRDTSMFLEK